MKLTLALMEELVYQTNQAMCFVCAQNKTLETTVRIVSPWSVMFMSYLGERLTIHMHGQETQVEVLRTLSTQQD